MIRLTLAALVLTVIPASAAFEPPAHCRGTPKAGTYVVHNVSDPDAHCRAMGTRPAAGRILGCTFGNMQVVTAKGKRAVDLIIAPPISHPQYAAILAHEFGHVNCPDWRD